VITGSAGNTGNTGGDQTTAQVRQVTVSDTTPLSTRINRTTTQQSTLAVRTGEQVVQIDPGVRDATPRAS
jgi:hypothetical protein